MMNLTKKGIAWIAEQENSVDCYVSRPEWPGESSGLTIGIGYDLGYNSQFQFETDWASVLPDDQIRRLSGCCGLKGEAAQHLPPQFADIHISREAALDVFERVTVPRFYLQTLRIYPQTIDLPPDAAAALVSLVFNRGTKLDGERRVEMAQIKAALTARNWAAIPGLFRAQKRLWPDTEGLQARRDREADLFAGAVFKATV